eukprot:COSAG01_NODE_9213_length_2517_cov_1.733251_4_plen_69_part_00
MMMMMRMMMRMMMIMMIMMIMMTRRGGSTAQHCRGVEWGIGAHGRGGVGLVAGAAVMSALSSVGARDA